MVENKGKSHFVEVPGEAIRQQLVGSQTTLCRILVVEDFAPFRRFTCSMLATRAGCQVVGEAEDGLEAVQKAADMQPDLVVLDIGLPGLNGLDCARRIRVLAPQSKIIFLSQESSADVVREALTLGCGYVFKMRTTSDLLSAVESAISEKQFVGTM